MHHISNGLTLVSMLIVSTPVLSAALFATPPTHQLLARDSNQHKTLAEQLINIIGGTPEGHTRVKRAAYSNPHGISIEWQDEGNTYNISFDTSGCRRMFN